MREDHGPRASGEMLLGTSLRSELPTRAECGLLPLSLSARQSAPAALAPHPALAQSPSGGTRERYAHSEGPRS